ncbi:MAG: hypothetical protein JWN90_703 [Parcubacteria group bacterium]|nr:hypothetical protein [Parcubacteria group bacterium]
MGIVHLTQGHHGLHIRNSKTDLSKRILLTSELLARPILAGCELLPVSPLEQGMIRCALQGLMDLSSFDAAVSYIVTQKGGIPHLAFPKRQWAEITLGSPDNVVAKFSHDSRMDNYPFYHLLDWLEEEYPDPELCPDDFAEFAHGWFSPPRWRDFFESRLRRQVEMNRASAESLRLGAEKVTLRANAIEAAFAQR